MNYKSQHINILKSIFLLFFVIFTFQIFAQEIKKPEIAETKPDTIIKKKKHSPALASTMSAVLPGLGQAYNKKFWKIPIVYAALGGIGYVAINNNNGFQKYKEAYLLRTDGDATTIDNYVGELSNENLETEMNKWRRARDFDVILVGIVYIFNIIDASVDANLFDFDVSDDLSLQVNPNYTVYNNQQSCVGLKLTFNIK